MKIKVKEILQVIGDNLINVFGSIEKHYITNVSSLSSTNKNSLDWINSTKFNKQKIAENSKAFVIICDESVKYSAKIKSDRKTLIQVKNPKLAIALILNFFFLKNPSFENHSSIVINKEAKIADNVSIGSNCSIGKCTIGSGTLIYPNVIIYDNVSIGENVIIHSGSVIGTDGLGCERDSTKKLIKFPHIGSVKIDDNVEIGANCSIAKGSLSETVIGYGSKINVGCYIAHNVILGKNVWLSAHACIAGSVKIEDNVNVFIGACIREQLVVGENSIIGMGAIVTKNIPKNQTWIGNPAKQLVKN